MIDVTITGNTLGKSKKKQANIIKAAAS